MIRDLRDSKTNRRKSLSASLPSSRWADSHQAPCPRRDCGQGQLSDLLALNPRRGQVARAGQSVHLADFRPASVAKSKIKKESTREMGLKLVPNPDIISEVNGNIVKVGFAAESEDLVKNATAKLKRKSLHLIVANNITEAHSGFGTDTNKVTLIDSQGRIEALPLLPKSEVAHKVLDKVVSLLNASRKNPGKPRRRK